MSISRSLSVSLYLSPYRYPPPFHPVLPPSDGDSELVSAEVGVPLPIALSRGTSSDGVRDSPGSCRHPPTRSPQLPSSSVSRFTVEKSLDLWGLGAVLCEVFTGLPPWSDDVTYPQCVHMAQPGFTLNLSDECKCGSVSGVSGVSASSGGGTGAASVDTVVVREGACGAVEHPRILACVVVPGCYCP